MKVFIMYKDRCTYIIVKDLTAAVNFIDKQKLIDKHREQTSVIHYGLVDEETGERKVLTSMAVSKKKGHWWPGMESGIKEPAEDSWSYYIKGHKYD